MGMGGTWKGWFILEVVKCGIVMGGQRREMGIEMVEM